MGNAHAHLGDLQIAHDNAKKAISTNEEEISAIVNRLDSDEEIP